MNVMDIMENLEGVIGLIKTIVILADHIADQLSSELVNELSENFAQIAVQVDQIAIIQRNKRRNIRNSK